MKRAYLIFIIIVFLTAAFFLCRTYIGKFTSGVIQESNNTPEELKKVHFIHWGEFPKEIFNKFTKKYPNIVIDYERFDEEYYPTIQKIRIASGNELDVMGVMNSDYEDFIRREYLIDLSDRSFLNNFKSEVRDAVKGYQSNRKEFAIAYKSEVFGIWYNKVLFSKYNIQVPKNYNDFLQVCKKLKSNGISPMVIGARDDWASSYICFLRFLNIMERDGNRFNSLSNGSSKWTSPEIESALRDISSFIDNGYLKEDSISLTYHQAFSEFTKGRAAMIIMGDSSLNLIDEDIEKVCEPGVFPVPYNDGGVTSKVAGNKGEYLTGIFSESKYKTEAEILIEYLSSIEAAQIYSNTTLSVPTVKGVDTSGIKFNQLWEPLRKTEIITPGITEMDHEMEKQFNKCIKEMIAKTKGYQEVLSELQTKQNELYSEKK